MRIAELSTCCVAALIALPGVIFLACGTTTVLGPAVDAGEAGPVVEAGPPDMSDAGPDAEQPPDIYPSKHQFPQLDFLGGPILDHLKIVTVTFAKSADAGAPSDAGASDGGDVGDAGDAGDAGVVVVHDAGAPGSCTPAPLGDPGCAAFRTFDDYIVKSAWWSTVMAGYKVSAGASGGYRELPDTVSDTSISDDDIQTLITSAITAGQLPTPDAQTLYAMYFPASTHISLQGAASCVQFAGYHNSVYVGTNQVAYAVLPLCKSADGSAITTRNDLTVTASHEFAEAASDPLVESTPAYYMATNDPWQASLGLSTAGGENGDVCILAPNWTEGAYKVQPIWSNAAAAAGQDPCQPTSSDPSYTGYYGAAVRTKLQKVNGHPSYGYLLINKGESQDAIIDVFSEKKLPHDLKIYAGVPKQFGSSDPTDLDDIQNGITATFSATTAHNGNGVVMTVTVPAAAVTTQSHDFKFFVRLVLEQDDFHDWPVIVHIN